MKDLINVVQSVKENADPKKARLSERFESVKTLVSGLKATSKNKETKAIQESIIQASNKRLDNYENKQALDNIEYQDLTVEVTHAKYNASLLDIDAKTMKYTLDKDINLSAAVNESREYKKRLKSFLEACAHKDASKLDKALAKLQAHMKANNADEYYVAEIQRIMEHSTATQASYFKKFAHLLGVVTAQRSNLIPMEVNKDSAIYKDFIAL